MERRIPPYPGDYLSSLRALAHRTAIYLYSAARQEPANLRTGEPQPFGEEAVEPLSVARFSDMEGSERVRHAGILID